MWSNFGQTWTDEKGQTREVPSHPFNDNCTLGCICIISTRAHHHLCLICLNLLLNQPVQGKISSYNIYNYCSTPPAPPQRLTRSWDYHRS